MNYRCAMVRCTRFVVQLLLGGRGLLRVESIIKSGPLNPDHAGDCVKRNKRSANCADQRAIPR